ncbi:YfiT family bacillithiol transferase [Botryobacter ruber]|uniref:YfiT family bacillithiol transferase n=1 Tax=Botryobacter ruber TaxID=2171629 RepID=UPI000E0C8122|nr:putative metal-dependent hydrolase [Botryobacter ruber]
MTFDTQRYPIGPFEKPAEITAEEVAQWIAAIASFPEQLSTAVAHLSDEQLDTPYRPGGWTIRQVVHHCADSHLNSFIRFKLALTEDKPTVKPYFEERWAELPDGKLAPVATSLHILDGLHQRWALLLRSLSATDLKKSFLHPEHGKEIFLDECLGLYAWHGRHHLAHITNLKQQKGWQ